MLRKVTVWLALLLGIACVAGAQEKGAQDVADIASKDLRVGQDANKRYFLIGPRQEAEPPKDGYSLLIVLPGGAGGEDFNPFVKRIFKRALAAEYLVAQPVAFKWTPEQKIVWPTRGNPVAGQRFSTEDFVAAVVKDVKSKHKLNDRRIFTLAWSSGGPAAYAISLQKDKSVTGSFIAMSVFNPNTLPSLKWAAGHAYFLYHSPDDRVCPFRMAKGAELGLKINGATVKLKTYEGGHGWRGDVYGAIRDGIEWLEKATEPKAESEQPPQPKEAGPVLFRDGLETGQRVPDGWHPGAAVDGVQYIWDKEVAFEGEASLCLKKTARRFFPIAQWYRTELHRGTAGKLRVSAQVKAEQVAKAILDVQFVDAQGRSVHEWAAYIGAKETGDPPADHDWQEYSGTVSIPTGTKAIQVALQIYGPGTVWFDDVTASYVEE